MSTPPTTAKAFAIRLSIVAICSVPVAANAAYPTRILTAAEKDNVVDIDFGVTWDRSQKNAKITREWVQSTDGVLTPLDVKELRYKETTQKLTLGLRIGLYHNLEFHIGAPLILSNNSRITFADEVAGRSTLCCEGELNADNPEYRSANQTGPAQAQASYPVLDVNQGERFRSGFGDMTFGLGWSPFVDIIDESFPTLTLKADLIAPTGSVRDPTDQDALVESRGGSVGRGLTVFDLSMSVSRRMQLDTPALDPYIVLGARIPIANSEQKSRGMEPSASGRFMIGTEIILHDEPDAGQRYAIDLSFQTRYVGEGRTYSELSDYLPNFDPTRVLNNRLAETFSFDEFVYSDFDRAANYVNQISEASCGKIFGVPCGELTKVDEYVQMTGTAALHLGFSEYAFLRAGISLENNTDHFLTNERVGKDLDPASASNADCDGAACVGRVNARNSFYDRDNDACPAGQTCDERSQYYDPRYDALGRRLRIEETIDWTVFVTGAATF